MVQSKQPPKYAFAGIGELESFIEKASPRTRAILRKECSVMLQCRCCANIFRCVPNFVLHKQKYCQNEYAESCTSIVRSVVTNKEETSTLGKGLTSAVNKRPNLSTSTTRQQNQRPSMPIRRTNIVRYLINKASLNEAKLVGSKGTTDLIALPRFQREVIAVPSTDGHTACYAEVPEVIAKEHDPDKVLLVIPQDLTVQYRNMSLRRRSVQPVARNVTIDEAQCVDRMNMFVDVDPIECRCLDPKCSEIRPFKDIFVLAYHVSVKHCCKIPPRNVIPCMMCAKNFITWETYYGHIVKKHDRIRKSHQLFRENEAKKRGRKAKGDDRDSRSMSPTVDGRNRDKEDAEAEKTTRFLASCCSDTTPTYNARKSVPKRVIEPTNKSIGSLMGGTNDVGFKEEEHRRRFRLESVVAKLLERKLQALSNFRASRALVRTSCAQNTEHGPSSNCSRNDYARDIIRLEDGEEALNRRSDEKLKEYEQPLTAASPMTPLPLPSFLETFANGSANRGSALTGVVTQNTINRSSSNYSEKHDIRDIIRLSGGEEEKTVNKRLDEKHERYERPSTPLPAPLYQETAVISGADPENPLSQNHTVNKEIPSSPEHYDLVIVSDEENNDDAGSCSNAASEVIDVVGDIGDDVQIEGNVICSRGEGEEVCQSLMEL